MSERQRDSASTSAVSQHSTPPRSLQVPSVLPQPPLVGPTALESKTDVIYKHAFCNYL